MKKFVVGILFCVLAISVCFAVGKSQVFVSAETTNLSQENVLENELYIQHLVGLEADGNFSNLKLTQAQTTEKAVSYYDKNGNLVTNRKAIERAVTDSFYSSISFGKSGEIELSEELKEIAKVANLYVSMSAGHIALSPDDRDKVVFEFSVDSQTETINSSKTYTYGTYLPNWVESKKYKLSENSIINFNFNTVTGYGADNSKGFYIFDPCLNFYVEIDSLELGTESQSVFAGQKISLNATNEILNLNDGKIADSFKDFFQIEWEVVSGNASLSNNVLTISETAKVGETVVVRAKSKSSPYNSGYIYSEEITFTVSNEEKLNIVSNFPEGFSVSGNVITINEGYQFSNISVVGATQNENVITLPSETTGNVELNLKKEILIKEIVVKNKVYDATTAAEIDYIGLNSNFGHRVYVTGLTANFNSFNAGETQITISGTPALEGEDKENYVLVGTDNLPVATGLILKRDVVVKAEETIQTYKASEAEISYTAYGLLEGETLTGSLSKEEGTEVGDYRITIGTLENSNYNIILHSNVYRITKYVIRISNISISKVYDKTKIVDNIEISLENNLVLNENGSISGSEIGQPNIFLNYSAEFINVNAGTQNVSFIATLTGTDKDSYEIEISGMEGNLAEGVIVQGEITPLEISVKANYSTKVYGEADSKLTYSITQGSLLSGDSLNLTLKRAEGETVGTYEISYEEGYNENYNIIVFEQEGFEITQREIKVNANYTKKVYGQTDPELTYSITQGNLVSGDSLNLTLKRAEGEAVGTYLISYEEGYNSNYKIILFQQDGFEIVKKEANVTINAKSKIFNNKTDAEFNYELNGFLETDQINLLNTITAKFNNKNVGIQTLTYLNNGIEILEFNQTILTGNNLNCYQIVFDVETSQEITMATIFIKVLNRTKTYGDADPTFSYNIEKAIEGIDVGQLTREEGEDVNSYNFLVNETIEGYGTNFVVEFNGRFAIYPKEIILEAEDNSKIYKEEDPQIVYHLSNGSTLAFDHKLEDVVTGYPKRAYGQEVGVYNYTKGTLSPLNINYVIKFSGGQLTILPAPITIKINNIELTYGTDFNSVLEETLFTITNGTLYAEDKLISEGFFEAGQDVGEYEIKHGTVNFNKNYDVTVVYGGKLKIEPKQIKIITNGIELTYGEEIPQNKNLTYMLEGEFLQRDNVLVKLSWETNKNAGIYPIQVEVTNGKNYDISFDNGKIVINPKTINVSLSGNKKTYGEPDAKLEAIFSQSQIIEGDIVTAVPFRESGEVVGKYEVFINSTNPNYLFKVAEKFEIQKRNLQVTFIAQDKVENETTQVAVSYVLNNVAFNDQLKLEFIARFENSLAGENKQIIIENAVLTGSKKDCYNLILPTVVTANITNKFLTNGRFTVVAEDGNTALGAGVELKVEKLKAKEVEGKVSGKQILNSYAIWLEKDGQKLTNFGTLTVKIKKSALPKNFLEIYVYNENGNLTKINYDEDNEEIVFQTNVLSVIVPVKNKNNNALVFGLIGSGIGIVAIGATIAFTVIKKKKSKF